MDSLLVIVQNLELASPYMLDLCTKYMMRIFNYTPCHPLIIIILTLFSLKQQDLYQPGPQRI